MSHNQCIEVPVLDLIPENIDKMNIVDCAFGYGLWGLFMRLRKNGTSTITGIELFEQHIKRMKNNKLYDNLVYASVANLPFREKSVDMTIACEVIEHLSREKGIMLLDDLDYITKGRTIISTPSGLYNYKIQSDDNKYNVHLSGWHEKDFTSKGYDIKLIPMKGLTRSIKLLDDLRKYIFRIKTPNMEIIALKLRKLSESIPTTEVEK